MAVIDKKYSISEEIANAVSHGIGALLSVAGLTLLVLYAVMEGDAAKITSFSIYGGSLVILFLASTLYHAIQHDAAKRILKVVDHCAIYLLIAGTYTPLMAVAVDATIGTPMLFIIWSLAVLGIIFKLTIGFKYPWLSLATYIGMGCASLFIINELYYALSASGLALLAIGGAVYTAGVYFYVAKKVPFNHAIWHLFVLGGASCHFFLIMFYV